ncbi:GatB/YqeY domain-containing protein [archaeon]|nr:GatB/YqeY domain-containing protein [archaeon]
MKISELNKERLTIRKTDPVRATVLNLLVDGVTKLAKQENREVEDKDFYTIATRSVKEIEKDIQLLISNNQNTLELIKELEIWKEFLPKLMNKEEVYTWLFSNFEKEFVLNKKNLGSIMKTAKTVENMDMQILSNMLKEV